MTRLVHIGDLHLQPGPRNPGRLKALDQIIDEAVKGEEFGPETLGAWLFPGDLNDARMSIDDRNALSERLIRMACFAPVCLIPGNHDLDGDLQIFSKLKAVFPVYVITEPQVLHFTLATGEEASCFCLPFPTRGGLAALGISHHDQLDAAAEALAYIFMRAGAELEEARQHGRLTFAIGHINVAGSTTSTGQPNVGQELEITADHLLQLGHCYKGLNHIHLPQEIAGAWYAGSVCRQSFGEIEDKRWLEVECEPRVIDVDAGECGARWDYRVTSKPIDVRKMFHVEGRLTTAGFTYEVTAGPGGELQQAPASWTDAEIRCRVTFAKSENDILSRALVQAEFADAFHVQYEFIAQPDRAVRAPEVAAAITFEDKARAWATVNGLSLSDTLIEKLHAIANGDKEQFLATLAAKLTESERQEEGVAA